VPTSTLAPSRRFIERRGKESFNKSEVYLRENKTKVTATNSNI